MMLKTALFCIFFVVVSISCTPLDDYVNAPDNSYSWHVNSTIKSVDFTAYVIRYTSQTWMTLAESNHPVWQHWLVVCVPNKVLFTTAYIYIDGGGNNDPVPTKVSPILEPVCVSSNTIGAHLMQIPNEPIMFADGKNRNEDAIIAYTWEHFLLNTSSNPIWLLQLPMTKAAVRALDTIQLFSATLADKGIPKVQNFVVSGASKRGWVTWLTGAVDKRVTAIIPIVMPILNITPNMNHHYQAYGGWSFALDDYLNMDVMHWLNHPEFTTMAAIIDPFSYVTRLTMPKYLITATGDEFFLPDSPSFFFTKLIGPKYMRLVPNAEHSLVPQDFDIIFSIQTFYFHILHNQALPTFTYTVTPLTNGQEKISVFTQQTPTQVVLWHANTLSTTRRDFRFFTCGDLSNPNCIELVFWYPKDLVPTFVNGTGVYEAVITTPTQGWTGYLIELEYNYDNAPSEFTFKVTTEIQILPTTMPFPPCGQNCQNGTFVKFN